MGVWEVLLLIVVFVGLAALLVLAPGLGYRIGRSLTSRKDDTDR